MRKIQVRKQIERECKFMWPVLTGPRRNAWSSMKISTSFSRVRHAQILQLFQAEIVKIIEVVTSGIIPF